MSLTEEERVEIVSLKLSKADTAYSDMLTTYNLGLYSTAANRLYYAAFYASSALLISEGHEAHTHSGNLSLINLHFIKPERIPAKFSKLLRDIFRLRQESDYDDYIVVDKSDLDLYIEPVAEFIAIVKSTIKI